MGRRRTGGLALLIVLILAGSLVGGDAMAGPRSVQANQSESQSVRISRDEAAAIARSRTGGRVLSVDLRRTGRPRYRVKVLVSGERVRTLSVDARTGSVID
jgi:uncharacterized membrane protein YkoI